MGHSDFKEMQELQSSRSCDNQQKWEQAQQDKEMARIFQIYSVLACKYCLELYLCFLL